jgi:Holliday junction resolvase RusA-like endonuclease
MELTLTLPVPTSVNSLYVPVYEYHTLYKKMMPTPKRTLSKEGVACKSEIQGKALLQLRKSMWNMNNTVDNFIFQEVVIYFNRRHSDADNIFKLLNDSLKGLVYKDDSNVLPLVPRVYYSKHNPRIEVKLSIAPYIGVFDNKAEYEQFVSGCQDCRYYLKGKCSILNDSLLSFELPEIDLKQNPKTCKKYTKKKK